MHSECCPWWGSSSSPWAPEASNHAWLPLVETSSAISRLGIWPNLGPGSCAVCLHSCSFFLLMQERQRGTFFSVFYLCINGGSLLSTIITPILRGTHEQHRNSKDSSALMSEISPLISVCVHRQLRNAASTRSRIVTLWPLAFQQLWWWSLWVSLTSFRALNEQQNQIWSWCCRCDLSISGVYCGKSNVLQS